MEEGLIFQEEIVIFQIDCVFAGSPLFPGGVPTESDSECFRGLWAERTPSKSCLVMKTPYEFTQFDCALQPLVLGLGANLGPLGCWVGTIEVKLVTM